MNVRDWQQIHGSSEQPTPLTTLTAGPLEANLDGVDLRYVRFGTTEVVRRILVAVRDPAWGTIPGHVEQVDLDQHDSGFAIHCRVLHQCDEIQFRWDGTIEGSSKGVITYAINGEALSSFAYARIGICVLLPFEHYIDRPYTGVGEDGSTIAGVFPREIAPQTLDERGLDQSPFPAVSRISVVLGGASVDCTFAGEVFEAEDQRNWTDASFKFYCPPLSRPQPFHALPGDHLAHSVTIALRSPRVPRRQRPTAVMLKRERVVGPVPSIGVTVTEPLSAPARKALAKLQPAHLRVDLEPPVSEELLAAAHDAANELETRLELAIHLGADAASELHDYLGLLAALPLARVIVLARRGWVTTSAAISEVRQRLPPGVAVGGGSARDFMELNLARPDPTTFDFLAWGINSQVHADDNTSLLESAFAHGETARTAHTFAPSTDLVVSRITLKAPPHVDNRQSTQLAAAWTATSLSSLLAAGVTSLTYFEASGPGGVTAADGTPLPLFEPLSFVSAGRAGQIVSITTDDPLRINAFAILTGERLETLVANATPFEQRGQLEAVALTLAPYEVRRATLEP